MAWHGAPDAPPLVRIASLTPALQPGEKRVVDAILANRQAAVERTAQQLADAVGVGRTTVIRAAQSLGYDGYPQLRVAVAQELALEAADSTNHESTDGTMMGTVRAGVSAFAQRLPHTVSALHEDALVEFIRVLDEAHRVLVVAGGLSSSLALDMVLRLNTAGRSAEFVMDALSQQITARQLGEGSLCVAISGSGVNRATLDAVHAATSGGAMVAAITSFARAPIADAADVALVVPPVHESFQDELVHTSRAAIMLLIEHLVRLLVVRRGEHGRSAQAAALSVLGKSLLE